MWMKVNRNNNYLEYYQEVIYDLQRISEEKTIYAIKEYFGKNYDVQDVRNGLVAAIAIRVIEPLFESQTKIKLGSLTMAPDKDANGQPFPLSGVSVNKFVGDFIKENVDNYLHMHTDVADVIKQKIEESEKERKAIAGVTKLARERAKKANLHNRKLRDCRIHLNDPAPKSKKKQDDDQEDPRFESSIFITEGDSASGSITKTRNAQTQAVFSLRGKPLNCFGLTKKVVYENEEFNLLQAALNIEDGLDGLRWWVSGHVPMTNGYETMLLMAWLSLMLGLLCARALPILRALAPVVAGCCMLVAHLASGTPRITALMPVLASPLLSLHVALVMMAYVLLVILALIAVRCLLLRPRKADEQLLRLTALSRLLLYPAVALLSAGIFVGAVWANISWGSYWSWDPKETWALITLMVYAVPLHGLPRTDSPRAYHLYILLALLTVLMTYFGVNYFLSGMHAYS